MLRLNNGLPVLASSRDALIEAANWHTRSMVEAGQLVDPFDTPALRWVFFAYESDVTTNAVPVSGPPDVVANALVEDLLTRPVSKHVLLWRVFNTIGCGVMEHPNGVQYMTCVFAFIPW